MTGIAAIQSRIAQIEAQIEAFAPQRATAATTTAATTGTAATFASSLTSALSSTELLGLTASQAATGTSAVARSGSATPGTGAALLEAARAYLGVPYVWGGETSSGMDCSGLVQRAFADLGVTVPRTAREQMTLGTAVSSLAEALPGDLIVQRGGGHIGIYVGNGQMLHAPQPGESVKIGPIYSTPTAIRRVLPTGETAAVDPTAVTSGTVSAAELARLALGLTTAGSTT